jgi:mono/diheme cytochrome c family protein
MFSNVSCAAPRSAEFATESPMPASSTHSPKLTVLHLVIFFIVFANASAATAQPAAPASRGLTSGEALFQAGCAGCHGPNGEGAPMTATMFDRPATFPDFTDCPTTTPELDVDWKATITEGGHGRGFSPIMPSFAEELTPDQVDAVIRHLRTLCRSDRYPRGELNLPRPLVTEKAFPESEAIETVALTTRHTSDVDTEFSYEHRLDARNQIELAIPFASIHDSSGIRAGGIGDVAVGLKHVLFASHSTIVSGFGEIVLPTGNSDKDLGSGVTTFSVHAMAGQILPGNAFVQGQVGTDQPVDSDVAPRTIFWRLNVGKSFRQENGLGRLWSPMFEVVGDREFAAGAVSNVDVVPQFQVTLNRRQHVRVAAGLQIPVSNREDRSTQFVFYLLWDWFDGGFFDGWH